MPAPDKLPLGRHLDFQAEAADDVAETVHARMSAKVVRIARDGASINATGNRFNLSSSVLWSCSYGVPLRLRFPAGQDLRIQFQRRGIGATHAGKALVAINDRQSCIYAGEADVDFGEDFRQVAWRVPTEVLERKLSALTGRILSQRLEFDPVLDLSTPQSRALLRMLDSLLDLIETGNPSAAKLLQAELESALLVSLLCSAQHNYRAWLEQDAPRPAPAQVRRAEKFIEENWNKPITLEDVVAASGASARSVFRGFREYRCYTPLQFIRNVRLEHAKRLLQDPDNRLSVTQIAMDCGFADITRFSKDFARAFGLPPSGFRKGGIPS